MRRMLSRVVPKALSYLPSKLLVDLEQAFASAQGKGWVPPNIDAEVRAALSFFPRLEPRLTVIDVGANEGSWTDALLRWSPRSSVWALEPSEMLFAGLKGRFSERARVFPACLGVSDESGKQELWGPEPGSGLGSLYRRRLDHFQIPFGYSETITLTTLDDFCARENLRPDLIKLDIEGHELAALRGARETLGVVKVVQFEFGGANIDSQVFWQDIWYLFEEAGFGLYRLSPRGVQRIDRYREIDEFFQFTNFFAVAGGKKFSR